MDRGVVQGGTAAADAQEAGALGEGRIAQPRHFQKLAPVLETAVFIPVGDDVLGNGGVDAGNVLQQCNGGGVEINAHMKNGYVARPYLGVGVFDKATAARQGYELNVDAGVYVDRVTLNGPAGRAGIQRGDIILEVGGTAVNTVADLRAAVTSHKVGDTVQVKYQRGDDKSTVDVTLDEMPKGN